MIATGPAYGRPMAFVALDGGSVRADEEFVQALAALKMDSISGTFAYAGEGYLRSHANRDNFHIVTNADGRAYDFFLKRHRGFEVREALKFLMTRSPFRTAGRREWDNIFRLASLGIATMRPVAVGERKWLLFERRSFLITERIPDAMPMDDFLRERYAGPVSSVPVDALRAKRALLWDVGYLVRRLHGAGLTHMDLYLNHVFVRETPVGGQGSASYRFAARREEVGVSPPLDSQGPCGASLQHARTAAVAHGRGANDGGVLRRAARRPQPSPPAQGDLARRRHGRALRGLNADCDFPVPVPRICHQVTIAAREGCNGAKTGEKGTFAEDLSPGDRPFALPKAPNTPFPDGNGGRLSVV